MSWRRRIFRVVSGMAVLLLTLLPLVGASGAPQADPPTVEEVKEAIEQGLEWLKDDQDPEGYWGYIYYEPCAHTALAVKKFMHHAVDWKWGERLDSPFNEDYEYRAQVMSGLSWLFRHCVHTMPIGVQPNSDPDSDADGLGVYWGDWSRTYSSGIGLMMMCEAVELDRVVEVGPLTGWTYEEVARDTMDYLAFGQNDTGSGRGGWGYSENQGWSDNSNSGYATLGLGFAETPPPFGCGFDILPFVKDELNIWVDFIQNDASGGSGYNHPDSWVNILKTGNLLQQMDLLGDTAASARVQAALGYMENTWNVANQDPGWRGNGGTSSYQATFTAMKGFTSLGIETFGDPPIDWQEDFETELLAEQHGDGHWDGCTWGNPTLCTIWALLTLQKVTPPLDLPLDIKPGSCPNPLNVGAKGVLPVAVLGTEEFDVSRIDPVTVQLMGVSPLRWAAEDVATPFMPYVGKADAYDCNEYGGDGYMDMTLKFDTQEVVAVLGDVADGDVLVLSLTGQLDDGTLFYGEDVVVILKKGKP